MRKTLVCSAAACLLAAAGTGALAQPASGATTAAAPSAAAAAGMVKRVEGVVTLDRAGQVLSVVPGTAVFVGDRIRTGAGAAVGIAMADETLLTAGANSTLLINDFKFNTTTHEGSLLASLLKGTLHVVTGLIAKAAPQSLSIKTPTVVLGVRGTEFIVEAGSEGA